MSTDSIFISDIEKNFLVRSFKNNYRLNNVEVQYGEILGFTINGEILKYNGTDFDLLASTGIHSVYFYAKKSPDGELFIVHTEKDLYSFKDKLVPVKKDLNFIRDVVFDADDNLWVATEEGLYNFFHLNFVNYTFGMGNKDWVWSVVEDAERNMWFASYLNGIWKWDGSQITSYTDEVNRILPLHYQKAKWDQRYRFYMGASRLDSVLYFPTECNVLCYNGKSFYPVDGLVEVPYQITKTFENGTRYFGCIKGLYRLSMTNEITFWPKDTLGVSSVLNVELDRNNNVVVVSNKGIAVISRDDIRHFNDKNVKDSYCSTKDYKENVWIAGTENINLFTGDTMVHVAQKAGEAFYSILFVKPNSLLLGGIQGMYVVDLDEYYSEKKFETILYNWNNGFTGIECGQNGFFIDSEGYVWLPTSDLVTCFDPSKLVNQKVNPPGLFVNMYTSSDNITWNKAGENGLFNYQVNNIKVILNAVSFANLGNIRYYYKLNGLQAEWSQASVANEFFFYNLKPGKYTFEAKADPGISKAMSDVVSINFTIQKPFWLRAWFFAVCFTFIIALIIILVQFFRKREQRKSAIQQRIIQLRSEALAAQLDPHFVMNCLNNISGLVNTGNTEQANDYIVKFSKLLRVILQTIKEETISLDTELEILINYLELERLRSNNAFAYNIQVPPNYSKEKIMMPPMLLQPLVENSIKHGFSTMKNEEGKLNVCFDVVKDNLLIKITDNGGGIKENADQGTGIGTRVTRERIQLLQQKHKIQFEIRNKDNGVEVKFMIPLLIKQ